MLKFENVAEIGDIVRAYDFKPMPDRKDRYIEGKVIARDINEGGILFYEIEVETDSCYPDNPRDTVLVPYQVAFLEFDNRVQKVA